MIHHGQIVAQGTPQELKDETQTGNLRDTFFAYIEGRGEDAVS